MKPVTFPIPNSLLYFASLMMLIITLRQVRRAARMLRLPVILSLCVCGGFLFYVSSLIPGILGLFTPCAVALTLSIAAIFTLLGLRYVLPSHSESISSDIKIISDCFRGPWNTATFLIGFLAWVGLTPLLKYLVYLPMKLFSPGLSLPWDTVSYHLPGLIEYFQAHSLWSLEGPYQSYCFGYELIVGFPSIFFGSHWGLVLGNAYAVIFLLVAIVLVINHLARVIRAPLGALVNPLTTCLLALSFWCVQFRGELARMGKNDIFMTACVLSVFGLLLEMSREDLSIGRINRRTALFILAIAGLSLGLATKPTALAYMPLFLLMVAIAGDNKKLSDTENRLYLGIRKAGFMLVWVLAIGGFFYFRNLLVFGGIVDPLRSGGWQKSLFANLNNPALYAIKRGSVIFGVALLAPLIAWFPLWQKRARGQGSASLLWMLAFHIIALLAFAITPYAIFHESLNNAVWKIRLGMPLFTSMAIIGALGIGLLAASIKQGKIPPLHRIATALAVILAVVMPWWWSHNTPAGLPGYESVKGLPETGIYRWVQGLDRPVRIYAAGLRPYGLYGPSWRNRVFYDLHSAVLNNESSGKSRLLAVIQYFHPDLILISVDPHPYTGPPKKPLVEWIRSKPYFVEVYCDDVASAFEVRDGWQELLEEFAIPNMPVPMTPPFKINQLP